LRFFYFVSQTGSTLIQVIKSILCKNSNESFLSQDILFAPVKSRVTLPYHLRDKSGLSHAPKYNEIKSAQEKKMPELTPFKVMIVDDHPLMRRGISQLLQLDSAFDVVAEAGDGASAIDLANRLDLDVILLDLNMKGMSGLDTLNALRRDGITAQIIILTVSDSASDVYALIDAGADGYLLKDSDPEVLLEAIRSGAKGGKAFSERVSNYLRERELFGAEEDPFSMLTERELDVLHELAQGLSNKQIASVLNISEQTVKVHIRNLLRKLNVRSRVAATILFLQTRGMQ
jgi:two-component system nitrate/nitrite response regulator NarP